MNQAEQAAAALGEGGSLTLKDGRKIPVEFSMYSLAVMTRDWGGLGAIQEKIGDMNDPMVVFTIGDLLFLAVDEPDIPDSVTLLKKLPLGAMQEVGAALKDGLSTAFTSTPATTTPTGGVATEQSPGISSSTPGAPFSTSPSPDSGK